MAQKGGVLSVRFLVFFWGFCTTLRPCPTASAAMERIYLFSETFFQLTLTGEKIRDVLHCRVHRLYAVSLNRSGGATYLSSIYHSSQTGFSASMARTANAHAGARRRASFTTELGSRFAWA